MSNETRQYVTWGIFWSVVVGAMLIGGWVISRQDHNHQRDIDSLRAASHATRVELREELKELRSDVKTILERLPEKE